MHSLGILHGMMAPPTANLALLTEVAMGLALIAGGVLARRRKYRAHAWCQSAVVLLNLVPVVAFMVPSFQRAIAPGLFAHFSRSYYWLATMHGVMGMSAELLGVYILLAAGTRILPQRFRFARYKSWMRSALLLWWLALLLGLATYSKWYGDHKKPPRGPSPGQYHSGERLRPQSHPSVRSSQPSPDSSTSSALRS